MICMNANTIILVAPSTPGLNTPGLISVRTPDTIRNWSLATVTSESNLRRPALLVADTPKILALLMSLTRLSNVVPVTVTSKSFSRIVSPGVNTGFVP